MRAREVVRRIERLGGEFVRQTGSHARYRATDGVETRFTTVPMHGSRDIAAGTLRAIEKDMEPIFGKGWLR
jgi:predicted RNA binding protein YcfA (HicA-like mRNA interferase family)